MDLVVSKCITGLYIVSCVPIGESSYRSGFFYRTLVFKYETPVLKPRSPVFKYECFELKLKSSVEQYGTLV
jgi:hypothetical protein